MYEIINNARLNISTIGISKSELDLWSQKIVCITGPSGVGKTTLCQELQKIKPGFFYLLGSTVTRLRNQIDCALNNYHIITEKKFEYMIQTKKFLHWNKTLYGYYGIEKDRIRDILKSYENIFVIFRSKSTDALKSVLPTLKVIELRAPLMILIDRFTKRERHEIKTINEKMNTAKNDMKRNELFYKHWSKKSENNWFQINNDTFDPPISKELVEKALSIIMKKY